MKKILITGAGGFIGSHLVEFLIKNNYKKSRLTIYNLHSTQENYFSDYKSILKKIDSQEKFLNPKDMKT